MNRKRFLLPLVLLTCVFAVPAAHAYTVSGGGPFFGVDLGVAEPTNDNYRAHVQTGGSAAPYFGYMFNDWLGIQGHLDYTFNPPDHDVFNNFAHANQWSSLLGYTAGPRIALPLGDLFEVYGMGEGGGFTGLSGRLNHTAPGFSVGGGLNVNLTPNFAVGLFGKWSRAYMSPRPKDLGPSQVATERFGEDIQWATAGVSMKWSFKQAAAPPPPPPPPPVAQAPPPPPPPTKEKIVLRGVHFDFNKYNIRPDARAILDEAARILKERSEISVAIEGHTDGVGSDAYNMKLSRRRADAVKTYLVEHGVAAKRIVGVEGFGKRQPVASNDTAEGRAQNRRVELRVR